LGKEEAGRLFWMGVAPEHGVQLKLFSFAVGKNNGSVEGQRYFQTDAQRGIFVRENDLVVLASPLTQ
jgi:dynactin complex subunit